MEPYRVKPVGVEAFRWIQGSQAETPDWLQKRRDLGQLHVNQEAGRTFLELWDEATDGWSRINSGDWIVRWPQGGVDVCPAALFAERYEAVPPLKLLWRGKRSFELSAEDLQQAVTDVIDGMRQALVTASSHDSLLSIWRSFSEDLAELESAMAAREVAKMAGVQG